MGYPSEKAPQTTHFHRRSHSPKGSAKAAGACHYSILEAVSLQLDAKSLCFVQGVFPRAPWFALGFENLSAPPSDLGFEEQRYPLHCQGTDPSSCIGKLWQRQERRRSGVLGLQE